MDIKNTAKKNGFLIRTLRNFFEHRALWLYLLCDEARKNGFKPETFAPAAIRRCGIYHGMRALTGKEPRTEVRQDRGSPLHVAVQAAGGAGGSCRLLRKKLFSSIGKAVFEMKFQILNDDAFYVDFHYCPLVNAWQKQGCPDEELDRLCDWAMEGDRGIADAFGCELELKKTIAKGDGVCQIRFNRKRETIL